jgi:hypothetical protein
MAANPNGAFRRADGTFKPGHGYSKGPHASDVARLRTLLYSSVSDDDVRAVFAQLVEGAKAGKLAFIRELLDRLIGKPPQAVHLTGDAGEDTGGGEVNLADLQLLVWELLEGHPDLRTKLAQRLREYHDQHRPADAGPRP